MSEILGIAREHLKKVKKSGPDDVMAICPFHRKADGQEEREGSFSMSIRTGLWYCHSCHEKGNLKKFLTNIGVSTFIIENRYKFVLEETEKYRPRPLDPLRPGPLVSVEEPLEESWLGLFDKCPTSLVEDDGFPEEILREFDVGFDDKNQRITFPLRDGAGRLIGISGRAVDRWVKPRFKVYDTEYGAWGLPSRTTEKRKLLWNVHTVFRRLREHPEDQYVVLVEGFKACMRVRQAGIFNVVAGLGSYLAPEQKWLLERMGVPVYVMFDNDAAGLNGRLYACDTLAKSTLVHLVEYDYDVQQPSDLTLEEICDAFFEAPPFLSWYIEKLQQLREEG